MKKLILILAVVAMVLPGCKKINEALDSLDGRLDKLEQETIPSIDEQIAAINVSLDNLNAMDNELKGYIDGLTATATNLQEQINATNTKIEEVKTALQNEISTAKASVIAQLESAKAELEVALAQINSTIVILQAKDAEIEGKIAELKTYVDTELGKTTDWVNATFATLEQYNALVSEITTIKEQIKAINQSIADLETRLTTKINEDIATAVSTLNADIQQKVLEITTTYTNAISAAKTDITTAYTSAITIAISNLDLTLKAWVGNTLSNYYTIAEVNAKIITLQNSITEGDAALQEELNSLKSQLGTTATEITAAYKKAIEEAIDTNNGIIDTKIANEIASVNQRINNEVAAINAKIAEIESRLDNVEAKIAELLARIQSVSYIPAYDDGKATVVSNDTTSQVTLDFEVSPKDAVVELAKVWQSAVSVKAVYTQTRAVSFIDMPIVKFESDAVNGIISITASAENLSADFFEGAQSVSACLSISDGNTSITSQYIPMVAKEVPEEEIISIPNNEIWYTTSDSVALTIKPDEFDAHIVSSTYNNSIGVIVFDRDVTRIGGGAFMNCHNLTGITIPSSVAEIGSYAFYGCSNLTRVNISDLSAWCKIDFTYSYANPLIYASNLYLNGVLLTTLTIPSDITEIKTYTFNDCSCLTSVIIPNSVTSIGNCAFSDCCSLTSVTIPDSITSIGDYAFYGCSSLTKVSIPNSVISIGSSAFRLCSNLISVVIPDSVIEIDSFAFDGCTSLPIIDNVRYADSYLIEVIDKNQTSYIIRDGTRFIGSNAFEGCVQLTNISIPNSIIGIGNRAFLGCKKLTNVNIPENITSIDVYAFSDCCSLTSVTIPDSVTSIGITAFGGCTGLTSIKLGNGVTSIGGGAFIDCISLTSIAIPDSVTSIGNSPFRGCYNLTEFCGKYSSSDSRCLIVDGVLNSFAPAELTQYSIPDNVTSIGINAFRGCTSLTSIIISDSVTSIVNGAFYDCTSLSSIYCKPTTPPAIFYNANLGSVFPFNSNMRIYVPRNSYDEYMYYTSYKNGTYQNNWYVYKSYIEPYDFE